MRKWKLSRKQQTIRNLLAAAAALAVLWWLLDFPALTVTGLIRRIEQAYLLEPVSKLILREKADDHWRILAVHEDRLLTAGYDNQLTGKVSFRETLHEPGMRCVLYGNGPGVYTDPTFEAWGLLEDVWSAQLIFTAMTEGGVQVELHYTGKKDGDFRILFDDRSEAEGAAEHDSVYVLTGQTAVMRTYDAEGALMDEWVYHSPGKFGTGYQMEKEVEGKT